MNIKILDRYVLKEMIGPFLVSVFAFVVLLIGRVIFDNIDFIPIGNSLIVLWTK